MLSIGLPRCCRGRRISSNENDNPTKSMEAYESLLWQHSTANLRTHSISLKRKDNLRKPTASEYEIHWGLASSLVADFPKQETHQTLKHLNMLSRTVSSSMIDVSILPDRRNATTPRAQPLSIKPFFYIKDLIFSTLNRLLSLSCPFQYPFIRSLPPLIMPLVRQFSLHATQAGPQKTQQICVLLLQVTS